MTEAIIPASSVEDAEPWVMPEMNSSHVVRLDRENRAGGFKKSGQPAIPKGIPKALTATRIKEIKEQAELQGFEKGREAGYQQGYQEAQSAGRELFDEYKLRMEQLVTSLAIDVENQLNADRESLEEAIASLVISVTEEVCMQQLAKSGAVIDIVKTALSALPATEKQATLSVSPADYNLLEGSPEFAADYLTLVEDESLAIGDCRVRSAHSDIEFLMEDRIKHSVQKHFSRSDESPEASESNSKE